MKCGIIRCLQREDFCPGTTDFAFAKERKGVFEGTADVEIVGFVSCGGCPGKRAVARAKTLVDRGAEAIVLASCIGKGNPFQFPCPHFDQMRQAIEKAVAGRAKIMDWTH